jgi:hypothetical protein
MVNHCRLLTAVSLYLFDFRISTGTLACVDIIKQIRHHMLHSDGVL